jgi:hypothetical protein
MVMILWLSFPISKWPPRWQQLKAWDEFLSEIQDRLLQSQVIMKSYHDQRWCEVVFQEGDWVWLRL